MRWLAPFPIAHERLPTTSHFPGIIGVNFRTQVNSSAAALAEFERLPGNERNHQGLGDVLIIRELLLRIEMDR